jgi:hypothetical protein
MSLKGLIAIKMKLCFTCRKECWGRQCRECFRVGTRNTESQKRGNREWKKKSTKEDS